MPACVQHDSRRATPGRHCVPTREAIMGKSLYTKIRLGRRYFTLSRLRELLRC